MNFESKDFLCQRPFVLLGEIFFCISHCERYKILSSNENKRYVLAVNIFFDRFNKFETKFCDLYCGCYFYIGIFN